MTRKETFTALEGLIYYKAFINRSILARITKSLNADIVQEAQQTIKIDKSAKALRKMLSR